MAENEVAREAAEVPAEDGLLAQVESTSPEEEAPAEPVPEPSHIDPSTGDEKPEWLPDRFWDGDKGADFESLAKSQNELYKKLRNGKHIVPEDSAYDLKFLDDKVAEDDALLGSFKKVASERGLTQDDFESIVGLVANNMPENTAEEEKFDHTAELEKLGPDGQAVINGHVKWAQEMVREGAWTGDDFEEFKVWGGTANGIRALTRLRQYYGEKALPVHASPDISDVPTQAEFENLIADPKYNTDPAFRQKVYKQLERMNPRDEGHMPTLS
jgi:hypothetical protein